MTLLQKFSFLSLALLEEALTLQFAGVAAFPLLSLLAVGERIQIIAPLLVQFCLWCWICPSLLMAVLCPNTRMLTIYLFYLQGNSPSAPFSVSRWHYGIP
jgi:hypothetical protein